MTTGKAGDVYAELIKNQLEEQRRRKESLQQRGIFVVTSSGTLAALLFGFAGIVRDRDSFSLPPSSRVFIGAAVVIFVLAAIAGLLANLPHWYKEAATSELRRLTDDTYWRGSEAIGSRRVAELHVTLIEAARKANKRRSRRVRWGLALEVLATLSLSIAVLLMLGS